MFYEPTEFWFDRTDRDPRLPGEDEKESPPKAPRLSDQALVEGIAELEEQGITDRHQQANELDIPYSTYMRRRAKLGLNQDRHSLGEWIPWTMTAEHHSDPIARKLRFLAQAAQGRDTKYQQRRAQAIRWATELVARNLDIVYSEFRGLRVRPANPKDWFLKRLLDAVMRELEP